MHADDLGRIVHVWEESRDTTQRPAHGLAEILDACTIGSSLIAESNGTIVGDIVARVHTDRASILMLGLAKGWRGQGLGSTLLTGGDMPTGDVEP